MVFKPSFDELQNIPDDDNSFLVITINTYGNNPGWHKICKKSDVNNDIKSIPFNENKIKYIIDSNIENASFTKCNLYYVRSFSEYKYYNKYNNSFWIACYNNQYEYNNYILSTKYLIDETAYHEICNTLTSIITKCIKQQNVPLHIYASLQSPLLKLIPYATDRIINDFRINRHITKYILYNYGSQPAAFIYAVKSHISQRGLQMDKNNKSLIVFHAIMSSSKFALWYCMLYDLLQIIYEYIMQKYMIVDVNNILYKIDSSDN